MEKDAVDGVLFLFGAVAVDLVWSYYTRNPFLKVNLFEEVLQRGVERFCGVVKQTFV
ncbi:hypothetical protein ABN702_00565 [Bacillus haimaensis]|uniref:hypothetical protein n=1 Tax=Bacillus haimaensis TaxID=3160967 RepID=UPI003AA80563